MAKELVVIEYDDLVRDVDLSEGLLEAWGPKGLGVIAIRGVPRWEELYEQVLRLSHSLAHLPPDALAALEHEPSLYNAGWSHGKEKLGDKPDFAKGSFYFNPLSDAPGTEEDREQFPWAMPRNLWPEELPELEGSCKALGQAMHGVCGHLARLVDRTMVGRVEGYDVELGKVLSETEKCKGRLLYYFPPQDAPTDPNDEADKDGKKAPRDDQDAVREDGWIGWHNDSGFLTALTPDQYYDDETGERITNPDPDGAGLWVVDRDGGAVHVSIPPDCMAVQVGECTQVVTGGALVATPHCVRGCRPSLTAGRRVARVSCPCFIDTHPNFPLLMPNGSTREFVLAQGLSNKVPPLGDRWERDGATFGDFLGASFRRYYEWALTPAATQESAAEAKSDTAAPAA